MKTIEKELTVGVSPEAAYQKFVEEFNAWWPVAYTWSQESLDRIYIDAREGGLCTEIGPHGFRCDWGRVREVDPGKSISFTWQISAKREPIPDPKKASTIRVEFLPQEAGTRVQFKHLDFDRHGEGAAQYLDMMDSEQGWSYILECFRNYCVS